MKPALVEVGGRFMTAPEMAEAAAPLGMPGPMLYLRGRAGAVGEVGPAVATALIAVFPAWIFDATWEQTAAVPAPRAVSAYADACAAWGRAHLAGLDGVEQLATLAEAVVDAADGSALPLFAAWRLQPRPADPEARAAHALMLLRELRGGLHFGALRSRGLDIPVAQAADPNSDAERLRRMMWPDDEATALLARAAEPGVGERWQEAEAATIAAYERCLGPLDAAGRTDLARLVEAAEQHSRAVPA